MLKRGVDLQEKLTEKEAELASTKSVLNSKHATHKAIVRECDWLNFDLRSARAALCRRK